MRSKKILWILLGVFGVPALLLVAGNRFLVRPAALKVQKKLESFVPERQVRVGPASTNWFNSFKISSVEISRQGGFVNGTAARAETLKLRYRLIDILLRRVRPEDGLASIELTEPSLTYEPAEPWKFKSQGSGKMAPLEITWSQGRFDFKGGGPKTDGLALSGISGSLDTRLSAPTLQLTATTPQNELLSLNASLENLVRVNAELEIKDFQPGIYLDRFKLIPGTVAVEGQADVSLKVSGLISEFRVKDSTGPPDLDIAGSVRLKSVAAILDLPHRERLTVSVSGSASFTRDKADFTDIAFKTGHSRLALRGSLHAPFGERKMEAVLSGQAGLDDARKLLGWRGKESNFKGGADLSLALAGTMANPKISASLKFNGAELYSLPLAGDAALELSSQTLRVPSVALKWGDGSVSGQGSINPARMNYSARVRGLTLNPFFIRSWDPEKISLAGGKLDMSVAGKGPRRNPVTNGNLKISNFFWGSQAGESVTLAGTLNYRKNSLRVSVRSAQNPMGLSISALTEGGQTRFSDCRLSFSPEETAIFNGVINHETDAVSGQIKTGLISTARLAPLLGLFSNFDGKVSAQAEIKGTSNEPVLSGTVLGRGIALKNSPEKIGNLSAEMVWTAQSFSLSKIVLGRVARGSFSYSRKDRSLSLDAALKGANPKLIFAFVGRPADIEGRADGNFSLVRRKNADIPNGEAVWGGNGRLRISSGRWGTVPFDMLTLAYRTEKSDIFLEDFSFRQKGGSLVVRGQTSQDKDANPLKFSANAINFMMANSTANGAFEAEGRYYIGGKGEWVEARARSGDFKFNKFSAGAFSGDVEMKDGALSLSALRWGSFFKGEGRLIFGQKYSPKIEANWISGVKSLDEWSDILHLENLPLEGRMSLSGKVGGSLAAMEHTIDSSFSEIRLKPKMRSGADAERYPGFSGTGAASLSDGVVKSLNVRAAQGQDGVATLLGQVHLKSKELILDTVFSKIDSGLVFQGLGWRDLKGKMDGHLEIKGPWTAPIANGKIKGAEGMLGNIPLDSWEVTGTFQEKELRFSRINLRGRKDSWRFSVLEDSWIKPQEDMKNSKFRIVTDFANISLGPVFFVGTGVAEGEWHPKEGGGALVFDATARMNDLTANNVELKAFQVRAQYSEKLLRFLPLPDAPVSVEGAVDFNRLPCVLLKKIFVNENKKEIFSADGEWCPDNPSFVMKGNGVDAGVISGILEMPFSLSGPSVFSIQSGPKNGEPSVSGNLALTNGRAEEIPLERLEVDFSWLKGMFTLNSLEAVSPNYLTLSALGAFPMKWGGMPAARQTVDFSAQCKNGNLSILNLFELELMNNAQGSFSGDLIIKGSPSNLVLSGKMKVKNGEFNSIYLNRKAQDLDLEISVQKNRVSFLQAACDIGEGRLKMEGSLQAFMEGTDFSVESYDLKLQTVGKKGIPILAPQLPATKEKLNIAPAPSRAVSTFALVLQGTYARPKISGWAEIDQALFSFPPPKKERAAASWFDRVDWDVELRTGRQTIFQNDYAYAFVNGKIAFKGDSKDLHISGKVTSNQGTVNLLGSKFEIRDATLEIVPRQDFKTVEKEDALQTHNITYLQFFAEKSVMVNTTQGGDKVPDTISIHIERTALTEDFDPKKIRFRSSQNPNMTSESVLSRVGFGQGFDSSSAEERNSQLGKGIAQIIDTEFASPIARSVLNRFGATFDVTQTDIARQSDLQKPPGSATNAYDTLLGTTFSVGKSILPRLDVSYRAMLDRYQNKPDLKHHFQIRYQLFRGIWLYGIRELDTKETLYHDPDNQVLIRTYWRFDPASWFSKKEEPAPVKKRE